MKRFIATLLAAVMTMSSVCFTVIVQAADTDKKLYIVRLSQAPIYEAGEDSSLSAFDAGSATSREMKLQSEQRAFKSSVKKNTDSNIVYEYDQVFNGMAVEATEAEIEIIKNLPNVTGVYESGTHTVDEPKEESNKTDATYDLGDNINADELRSEMNKLNENSGDGEGMVIAVVDSEFDVNHEAFTLTDSSDIKIHKKDLSSLLTGLSVDGIKANQVYKNDKIPFVFNYVNQNSDVMDYNEVVIHGSHVAGIAAGNSDTLRGIAPNAQLVLMKCATDDGAINDAAVMAAINDAVKMKVDVINLSLGASYENCPDDEPYIETMKNVSATSTELFAAAGNSGMGYDDTNVAYTSEVAYDSGGIPSGSRDIAVVGNAYGSNNYSELNIMKAYMEDGTVADIHYVDGGESDFTAEFKDKAYEMVDAGYGEESDYEDLDVTGKIVLVRKGGSLNSVGKRMLIKANGGIGMIFVLDELSGTLYDTEGFPAAVAYTDEYDTLKKAKYIQATEVSERVYSEQKMDTTSSYVINEYLDGGVQLCARGASVLSSLPNDDYGLMTGTSMASPMAAGAYTLVKSYLQSKYPDISSDTADFTTLCVNMMQNTADIIYNPTQDESAPYSPRLQGAGYINLGNLSKSDVVLTNKDSGKGMVYCGATESNEVSFTLCLENLSDKAVTYNNISGMTIRDYVNEDGYICNASVKADSSFNMKDSVTVPAGETVEFPVTVSISSATRNELDSIFENGFFLDGFISFEGDGVQAVSIPFTSFIGDYFKAPVFSRNGDGDLYIGTSVMYGNSDKLMYATASEETEKLVVSENKDSNAYLSNGYEPTVVAFLMRGAQRLDISVKNSDGNMIYKNSYSNISKYQVSSFLLGDAFEGEADGDYSVTIDGVLNSDKSGNTVDSLTVDVYLDSTAPEIDTITYDEENDRVVVTASDNYGLYCAAAVDGNGNHYDEVFRLVDGVYTASLDVSELNEDYDIYVYDYAQNYDTTADADTNTTESNRYLLVEGSTYYEGSIYCKNIAIVNLPKTSTPVTPILAIYDKDGKLLKTEVGNTYDDFTRANYTFKVKLTEPNFPNMKIPEDASVKLFLWDTVSDMTPLEYVTYNAGN